MYDREVGAVALGYVDGGRQRVGRRLRSVNRNDDGPEHLPTPEEPAHYMARVNTVALVLRPSAEIPQITPAIG